MTLQEHYNSIVGGKGNKAQFLKQARHLFPQHITNLLDFDTTVNVLKSKQIISENTIGGVVSKGFNIVDWKKVLAEETKAVEKNVSKEVEDYRKNAYNNADMKNADNVNFNEIMKGFYLELKNPKNHDKTVDELKDIVVKNLAKDALHYTKDGMFGVEGVGFTDEAPSLKQPVEPKGKHKSSGYGDLDVDVEKVKANVKDTLSNSEAKTSMPKKVKEMPVTPQNSAGVKKMKTPGAEKRIKLKEVVTGENPYFDTDPSDGDADHESNMRYGAENYYDKGKKAFEEGDLEKAQEYYKQALDFGGWLGWTEKDLPPYSSLKENTDVLDQHLSVIDSNKMSRDEAYAYLENTDLNPSQINTIMNYAFPLKLDKDIPFQGMTENEALYQQLADLQDELMNEKDPERAAEIEAKIKALETGLRESKVRSLIAKLIKEELNNESFNQWKEELYNIVMDKANMEKDEISIDDKEIQEYYNEGKTPSEVYFDIWQQDAGNFFNIPL